MLELTLKLGHEKRRLFLISLFEYLADANQHRPRDCSHDNGDRHREQQKELLP
jgi:hypothetical protein